MTNQRINTIATTTANSGIAIIIATQVIQLGIKLYKDNNGTTTIRATINKTRNKFRKAIRK